MRVTHPWGCFILFLLIEFCNVGEKGGGPYGSEVTRGQDLTGRDFSGKTLVKQDFKTVSLCCVTLSIAV